MDRHTQHKALIKPLLKAMYDFEETSVRRALSDLCADHVVFKHCHPFGTIEGSDAFYNAVYKDMFHAIPDLERRDYIVMAGSDDQNGDWVGCGGYYTGEFLRPWLDILPTGHQMHLRFHEFYRFVDGKVVEFQALWDLPELMMLANAWPMVPSLGFEWNVPGPATLDGNVEGPYDEQQGQASCDLIIDMLNHLKKHPTQGGPEVMEMEKFWHPRMSWYGPAGIGTGRGIAGFRNWHQIPFLNGMPDRGQYLDEITYHFFGDKNYAAVTGWPDMVQTITHDGWLGIPPLNKKITMRSLDFWRIEDGLIRENWVLVDLLHMYDQIGVDVFARIREFNKAKSPYIQDLHRVAMQ